tara:strand:+ start:3090 stop:3203 length:114 start_codon:yes stop_codon:yes gene_type:complete
MLFISIIAFSGKLLPEKQEEQNKQSREYKDLILFLFL